MNIILLTIFGWKEIYLTQDKDSYFRVKSLLETSSIRNKSRILHTSRERGVVISSISNSMYYLYVRKDKYLEAKEIIA